METKKGLLSKRVLLYPIAVFVAGLLIAALAPVFLSGKIDPVYFGSRIGRLTANAFVFALIAGLIVDWNRRKKSKQQLK